MKHEQIPQSLICSSGDSRLILFNKPESCCLLLSLQRLKSSPCPAPWSLNAVTLTPLVPRLYRHIHRERREEDAALLRHVNQLPPSVTSGTIPSKQTPWGPSSAPHCTGQESRNIYYTCSAARILSDARCGNIIQDFIGKNSKDQRKACTAEMQTHKWGEQNIW